MWNSSNNTATRHRCSPTKPVTYTFDTEGRAYQYARPNGSLYTYTYDEMGRPKSLDQYDAGNNVHQIMAQNAQYSAAGQMT